MRWRVAAEQMAQFGKLFLRMIAQIFYQWG
jgi:hypothetical protein